MLNMCFPFFVGSNFDKNALPRAIKMKTQSCIPVENIVIIALWLEFWHPLNIKHVFSFFVGSNFDKNALLKAIKMKTQSCIPVENIVIIALWLKFWHCNL